MWFLLLPASLAFEILGKLLCPVLPLFAQTRAGALDNASGWGREPRLPRWLAWFDTPDNSLWGDTGWRTQHCPNHWDDYLGMVGWLWRNTGGGFSLALSRVVWRSTVTWSGDPHVSPGRPGTFRAKAGAAWQYKTVRQFGGWAFYLNVGWLMDAMVKDGSTWAVCAYKFSPKLKRVPA